MADATPLRSSFSAQGTVPVFTSALSRVPLLREARDRRTGNALKREFRVSLARRGEAAEDKFHNAQSGREDEFFTTLRLSRRYAFVFPLSLSLF